jgi:crotonobetainyl-CoA:carnitine CoA-transferase CaiB-like acyl-CoA transferase
MGCCREIPIMEKHLLSGYMVNYNVYECADKKWVAFGDSELKFWNSFCDMVDHAMENSSN